MENQQNRHWRIEFVEKPLDLGPLDNWVYNGRDASHSFLRLMDPDGNTRSELHGFSFDSKQGKKLDFSFNLFKRLRHFFNAQSRNQEDFEPNYLNVFVYDYAHTTEEPQIAQKIFEGSEDDVLKKWILAKQAAVGINKHRYVYRPFGVAALWGAQNCHTISKTLMQVMGLEPPTPVFATPGYRMDLKGLSLPFLQSTMEGLVDVGANTLHRINERLSATLRPHDAVRTRPQKPMAIAPEFYEPMAA